MKIVQFAGAESGSPDSAEWHAWRANGIGGSDALTIANSAGLIDGEVPKWAKSENQLYEQKAGIKQDEFRGNWATERGRQGEEPVRRAYEKATGILISPMFGEMESNPFVRSSFDGLTFDLSVITEIKCPGQATHQMARNGKVVPYYKPQLVHQALTAWDHPETWDTHREIHFVTGVPELLRKRGGDKEGEGICIVRHRASQLREYALKLLPAEEAFWKKVMEGQRPSGDGWDALAICWLEAKAEEDRAKQARADTEVAMRAYLEARGLVIGEGAGVRFKKECRSGSVDYAKAIAAAKLVIPDDVLESCRKAGSESWVARPIKQ